MEAYEQHLQQFVYHSGTTMKPVFQLARSVEPEKKRIVFAEGEEERVLRAVQIVVDEKIARPILIGRPAVIEQRIAQVRPAAGAGQDYTVVDTDHDERYRDFWQDISQDDGAQGHQRADGEARNAPPHHADRRDAGARRAKRTA